MIDMTMMMTIVMMDMVMDSEREQFYYVNSSVSTRQALHKLLVLVYATRGGNQQPRINELQQANHLIFRGIKNRDNTLFMLFLHQLYLGILSFTLIQWSLKNVPIHSLKDICIDTDNALHQDVHYKLQALFSRRV